MSNSGIPKINLNSMMIQIRQLLAPGQGADETLQPNSIFTPPPLTQQNLMNMDYTMRQSGMLLANMMQPMAINPAMLPGFFKELMRLPQEIQLLLLMLALETPASELKNLVDKSLAALIQDNGAGLKIPIQEIQDALGKSTLQASDKLIKLLMSTQMGQTKDTRQIAELSTLLNKMSEQIQSSPAKALENLVLLYLPWYPLVLQQKLELNLEFGEGEEAGGIPDISVILYLDTNTLGRFKIMVQELNPLQLSVHLSHEESAKGILSKLEASLNAYLSQEGLPQTLWASHLMEPRSLLPPSNTSENPASEHAEDHPAHAPGSFKGSTRLNDQKQLTILHGSSISLLVLNSAYRLARFIFEMDEAQRVLQQ